MTYKVKRTIDEELEIEADSESEAKRMAKRCDTRDYGVDDSRTIEIYEQSIEIELIG